MLAMVATLPDIVAILPAVLPIFLIAGSAFFVIQPFELGVWSEKSNVFM